MLLRTALFNGAAGSRRLFAQAVRSLSALPEHKELTMPKVSPTMTHGRFIAWKKAEGEPFQEGEDIAEVESDKSTMPIAAREDGFIARIFVEPDTPDLPLDTLLAITVEQEEYIAAFKDYVPPSTASPDVNGSAPEPASPASAPAPAATSSAPSSMPYTGPIGPAVARLMNMHPDLDLSRVKPTGPKGHVLKGDVLAAIADGSGFAAPGDATPAASKPAPLQPADSVVDARAEMEYTDVPVTSMRRAIARHVLQSKQEVPHQYARVTYELDKLLALRKRINASMEADARVSVNDLIIRATAVALQRVPEMNVRYDASTGDAVPNETVDISFAIAIPDGLVLPVVYGADRLGLAGIAAATKDLVQRARTGALRPKEYEGGGFGISNLGMFGIDHFCAIISPPQSGMLAIGAGSKFCALSLRYARFATRSRANPFMIVSITSHSRTPRRGRRDSNSIGWHCYVVVRWTGNRSGDCGGILERIFKLRNRAGEHASVISLIKFRGMDIFVPLARPACILATETG